VPVLRVFPNKALVTGIDCLRIWHTATTVFYSWVIISCLTGDMLYRAFTRPTQLNKIHSSSLNTTHSAGNLGFVFDEHVTFSDQISAISRACLYHRSIRHLRCIRPYLDSTTVCTIASSNPSFTPNSITVTLFTTAYI